MTRSTVGQTGLFIGAWIVAVAAWVAQSPWLLGLFGGICAVLGYWIGAERRTQAVKGCSIQDGDDGVHEPRGNAYEKQTGDINKWTSIPWPGL